TQTTPSHTSTTAVPMVWNDTVVYHVPEDVAKVLAIRYHIVFPIFITLGILTNAFCIAVTRRKKLRALHSNAYIQVMAVLDIMSACAYLPFVFDNEFCLYKNYTQAFYFTRFGFIIVNCIRSSGTYILVFLTYDRFLAIWFPQTFQKVKTKGVLKKRLIILLIWISVSFIP
ncbi:unnamed protein product, partial [Meganyctiphanes norvegica]